jgi:peroxiredoxin
MRIGLYSGASLIVTIVLVAAYAMRPAPVVADDEGRGREAPAFELTGADGKTYRLGEYKDRIVVLEWWNQDCPVSRAHVDTMKKLASTYADRGVVWLAIDSTHYQKPENDRAFIRKHGIPYPVLMDTDGKVGRAYDAKTTPHMFVIEKGTIVYEGAISDRAERNYVAEALEAVLAGKQVPLARTRPFGCSVKYAKADTDSQKAEIGKPAPDFELTAVGGGKYKLSDYKDKVVVLEWWNQDCPFSRRYTPTMKALAARYAEKGVVWLAIDSTNYQTAEQDREYQKKHELPYPILMDFDGKVGRRYDARTTPHMFVINRRLLVYSGAIDNRDSRNYVAEALDAVLAGKDVPLKTTQPFGCSVKYKEQ